MFTKITRNFISTAKTPKILDIPKDVKPNCEISWNEYFKLRKSRNRIRPIVGVPSFFAGTLLVMTKLEFSPIDPILGIDPAFMYGISSILAGTIAYQIGASIAQIAWRTRYATLSSSLDTKDKLFYDKIQTYRAERGQSPYIQTTGNLMKLAHKVGGKNDEMSLRQDFYGERVSSVSDYRQWLRKQRKLTKEQLGNDAPDIRGIR